MSLSDYTSPDQVRAALGVSDLELSDATLSLNIYEMQIRLDLEDISDTLADSYLVAAALPSDSRTTLQQKLVDLTQLFSTYSVSKNLLTSLKMFGPKRITDGRAETERFDPMEEIKLGILANYSSIRNKLITVSIGIGNSTPPATVRTYVTVASLGTDPVTGV